MPILNPRLDSLSRPADARKLADEISAYWAERGYRVRCWVSKESSSESKLASGATYSIRSDMLFGLPADFSARPRSTKDVVGVPLSLARGWSDQ
jgi:hypothetical protein